MSITEPKATEGVKYIISWSIILSSCTNLLCQITLMVSWVEALYDQLMKAEKSEFASRISQPGLCAPTENGLQLHYSPTTNVLKNIKRNLLNVHSSTLCGREESQQYKKAYE